MASLKTYVPGSGGKEETGKYGSFFKLYFKADELIKFTKEHQNQGGWLNLTMSKRREPGKKGETHYIALDTWKPTRQATPQTSTDAPPIEEDDVPF